MANFDKIVYIVVVILCFASAVMCENDSSVQGRNLMILITRKIDWKKGLSVRDVIAL